MKNFSLKTASGETTDIPMFDPIVAHHFSESSSYVETLLDEINKGIYAPLFEGRKNLTFLDIGANVGLVSLYAAPACSRIVGVEPDPETFNVLGAMTHSSPNIEVIRAALAPHDGDATFYRNDINSTASSTVNTYGEQITVPALTLTRILSIHQLETVDVCKIDCEGGEGESLSLAVLEEARPIIKSFFIETHNCPKDRWEEKLGRLVRDLSKLGYYSMKINGMALFAERT